MDVAVIRQGELVGRGVMAYETTEEVGAIAHLLVDVKRSTVIGLVCKTGGLMGRKQTFGWAQLMKIGRDRLIVRTEATPELAHPSDAELAAAQDMTNLEVWTDGGDHIGRIVDVCLERQTGEVQQYLFALNADPNVLVPDELPDELPDDLPNERPDRGDRQMDEPLGMEPVADDEKTVAESVTVYGLDPQAVISAGRKRMMISEAAAQQSQPYSQLLNVATPAVENNPINWRPDQLPTAIPTDFGDLLQKGKTFASRATERVKQFTDEQLANQKVVEADSLPDITEQLQEKAEQAKQQMQRQLNKARDKAKDQLDDRLGDRWNERIEDRLGKTPFGRSLGKKLDQFKRPQSTEEPIDVDAFEVWEDD